MSEVRNYFWRERCAIFFSEPSRTKQSPMESCDINAIVRRWQTTGVMDHLAKSEPRFGDFTQVEDYLSSLNRVTAAQRQFDALPAGLREVCGNDPSRFVAYMMKPENAAELRTLGLEKLMDELHGPLEAPPVEPPAKPAPEPPVEPEKAPDQIPT